MLKVIANIINQSSECSELMNVKKLFLTDLINLCKNSRNNRRFVILKIYLIFNYFRIILQMSVWQEWLISLVYVNVDNEEQEHISNLVYEIFSILLFHAIRLEYGGWRVWVDTLAITHSKVSLQNYCRKLANKRLCKTQSLEKYKG